jgi:hypothetical protein
VNLNPPTIISARNVNDAFESALYAIRGYSESSVSTRNGPVIKFPGPVVTHYSCPEERILWNATRDANPFFHLMECIWMLAGRNDLSSILPFNSNFASYAEPDGHFHGAYGYRWRYAFGFDQLPAIVRTLKEDPSSRRVVLQMWSADIDLGHKLAKDLPCNTHIYFEIDRSLLNMTVCNRSNDMVWGAYGANAVHFSFLQQYLAEMLGVGIGMYYQFSNNMHLYTEFGPGAGLLLKYPPSDDEYTAGHFVQPYRGLLSKNPDDTLAHYRLFWNNTELHPADYAENFFLASIAYPMRKFYLDRKVGKENISDLESMPDCDWKLAAIQWSERHAKS